MQGGCRDSKALRLGVNVDHVATVRNARGGDYPDPVQAAKIAEKAGADGITALLRRSSQFVTGYRPPERISMFR